MASNGIRDKVAIVGMGCTNFGEHWDKSVDDLLVDAVKEASTSSGIPAFDLATSTMSGAIACIFSTTGSSSSGPLPQFPPMASAPAAASAATAVSGETPIIV